MSLSELVSLSLKIPDLEYSPEHWAGGGQHQSVGGEAGPRLVPGHQSHVTEVTRLQPIGSQYSGHVISLDQSEASILTCPFMQRKKRRQSAGCGCLVKVPAVASRGHWNNNQ